MERSRRRHRSAYHAFGSEGRMRDDVLHILAFDLAEHVGCQEDGRGAHEAGVVHSWIDRRTSTRRKRRRTKR